MTEVTSYAGAALQLLAVSLSLAGALVLAAPEQEFSRDVTMLPGAALPIFPEGTPLMDLAITDPTEYQPLAAVMPPDPLISEARPGANTFVTVTCPTAPQQSLPGEGFHFAVQYRVWEYTSNGQEDQGPPDADCLEARLEVAGAGVSVNSEWMPIPATGELQWPLSARSQGILSCLVRTRFVTGIPAAEQGKLYPLAVKIAVLESRPPWHETATKVAGWMVGILAALGALWRIAAWCGRRIRDTNEKRDRDRHAGSALDAKSMLQGRKVEYREPVDADGVPD